MRTNSKYIPLFFWSEKRFIYREKENYGDLLSKYIVEKITGKKTEWVHPKKQSWFKWNKTNLLAIGSIIHHANINSIVWGSGIIDSIQEIPRADFRAVRGPETRNILLDKGYSCPQVYGDPALLLPLYYYPKVEKQYKLGIVPHYHDYVEVSKLYGNEKNICVIDLMTMDVEEVTMNILSCEMTISSSLHGVIVSHAYSIPSVWVKFSDKIFGDGIKYKDYLTSVDLPIYEAPFLNRKMSIEELMELPLKFPSKPEDERIKIICKKLLKSFPPEFLR